MKPRYSFTHELIPEGISLRLLERRWMSKPESISVDNWSDCMADQAFSGVSKILALAMSPAVADELRSLPFRDVRTASRPNEDALLALLA